MTVHNIAEKIKSLKLKWHSNIVVGRPSEEAILKTNLGQSTSYAAVSSQIENWGTNLGKVAGPRVSRNLPKHLVQSSLQALSAFDRSLDHAGNGLEWMFQNTNFGTALVLADTLIAELAKDSSREQAQILEAAQVRLSEDLKSLQDGGEIANEFKSNWPSLREQIAQIEASNDSIGDKVMKWHQWRQRRLRQYLASAQLLARPKSSLTMTSLTLRPT